MISRREELADDKRMIKRYLKLTEDVKTSMALSKLSEVITAWQKGGK